MYIPNMIPNIFCRTSCIVSHLFVWGAKTAFFWKLLGGSDFYLGVAARSVPYSCTKDTCTSGRIQELCTLHVHAHFFLSQD